MGVATKWWHRVNAYRRLRALEAEKLAERVKALEARLDEPEGSMPVEQIVRGLQRCQRCGVVHFGGNGLAKVSANVDGEVMPVVVCGMCKHLVRFTGRGR